MQFNVEIPYELGEESVNYADTVVIDGGGCDLIVDGERYTGSFLSEDIVEIALAVLEEEFKSENERAEAIVKLGTFTVESLENLGYVYLKASQIAHTTRLNALKQAVANA